MSEETQIQFYPTNLLKFSVLSVATFGLYELYWFYKCWKYVKIKEEKIYPFWRAFFAPFWTYALCMRIFGGEYKGWSVIIFLSYFVITALWRLPDPYWLLSSLTFVPILPLVKKTNDLNAQALPATYSRFGWKHILVSLLGIFVVVGLTLQTLNILPSTQVVPGDRLWASDVEFLKEINVLSKDEEIVYFYSSGLFSIKEDGNFFTDKRVVSYWQDSLFGGELVVEMAAYNDIAHIKQGSTDIFGISEIKITRTDGSWFFIVVSSEGGKDKDFVIALRSRWSAKIKMPAGS